MENPLCEVIVEGIRDKKGHGITVLDLSAFDGAVCPWFVLCNADSTTQVAAIAAGIEERVEQQTGEKVLRVEGLTHALWVAMDYGDVIVHIFQTPLRDFYRLEQLWADAPRTDYPDQAEA